MAKDDKDWNFDRLYSALASMQEVQNDIARAMHKGKMNDVVRDRWPFASADSVNVALNFKGSKSRGIHAVCPERMARNIDARQSPVRWRIRPTQECMFSTKEQDQ